MISSITALGQPRRDFIYDSLKDLDAYLCVDVGAAAGATTRRMLEAMPIGGRVVAFEPFPGNIPHFRAATAGLTSVTLHPKAVSEKVGFAELYVDSVVRGTEPGWEDMVGYSSVGHLRTERFWVLRKLGKTLRRWLRNPASILDRRSPGVRVVTTSLDAEFPDDRIDFVKVDVQGAEARVLRGAKRLLRDGRASLWYVEWAGDREVPEILGDAGFTIFDANYVGVLRGDAVGGFEKLGFRVNDRLHLSVGRSAYDLTYQGDSAYIGDILRSVRRRGRGWIQTDLIAVAPTLLDRFVESARKRLGP